VKNQQYRQEQNIMKLIRWLLGRLILAFDFTFRPRRRSLTAEQKQQQQQSAQNLSLYQYLACPFCVKVRREMRRLDLAIPIRDAKSDESSRQQLEQEGGRLKVPCLRIDSDNGESQWLYESNDIINYLRDRFPA